MALPLWLAVTVQVPVAAPVTVLPATVQVLVLLLVNVTGSPDVAVALTVVVPPTAKVPGVKVTAPTVCALMPEPFKLNRCGLPGALLTTVRVPLRLPAKVGVKRTFSEQLSVAPKPVPQLWVTAKSPLVEMLLRISAAFPVLVSVTVCAALTTPMADGPKFREPELSETAGPFFTATKVADTFFAKPMLTTQLLEPEQCPPQLENVLPGAGVAVRLTELPLVKLALQVAPQLMPTGLLVTVPEPDLLTDSTYVAKGSVPWTVQTRERTGEANTKGVLSVTRNSIVFRVVFATL